MACNIATLPYIREIGFPRRSIAKQSGTRTEFFHSEKEFMINFHQHHMKDIFCQSSQKYLVPGEVEAEVPPYAVEFSTAPGSEETFAVADENGAVTLFSSSEQTSEERSLKPLHKLLAHNNAIFDIAWIPKENFLGTASGDQTAALWDVLKGEVVTTFKGHTCSLKSINVSKHNTNLLVTGSRDGNALIWDKRSSQSVIRIQDAHVIKDSLTPMRKKRRMSTADMGQLGIDSRQTVSCALFLTSNTVITSGAMDGTLKIWDLRKLNARKASAKSVKNQPLETIPYPGASMRRRGYTCLTLDSFSTNLYASCTDDAIYHFNLAPSIPEFSKRQPLCKYQGQYNTSFYIRTALSPGNEFLFSGSDDNRAYIWRADGKSSSPILRLVSEGMSEVTAVAWCPHNITKLVTCSDECVVRLWNLPYNGKENIKASEIDGQAEVLQSEQEYYGEKGPGPFTPISIVRREPQPDTPSPSTSRLPNLVTRELFTPTRELFTPRKITPTNRTPTSVTKMTTPLRNLNKVAMKTPNSIERWLVRPSAPKHISKTDSEQSKSRVVKCLESHMTKSQSIGKENSPQKDEKDANVTPQKNWLAELSKTRRSKNVENKSPAFKRRKSISSPTTTTQNDRTPVKQLKTLDSYLSPRSFL